MAEKPLFTPHPSLFTPDAVVLANGDYPSHPIALRLLTTAPYVVCCDGGANTYMLQGHTPDAIVGDGDSLLPEFREQHSQLVHRVSEQETNDLTKAMLFLKEKGKRRIAIVGATGKREDHTLGNISLLRDYRQEGFEVRMFTDHGIFIACEGDHTFECRPGEQVTIIGFGTHGMHGKGLVYPLRDFTNWWQGTLNECTGTEFTIWAEGEYLVFFNYE